MNLRVMQRLMWKDFRVLRALALAIPALTLGFYILLVLATSMADLGSERLAIGYAIWLLLPMLIAYGAPAVLVGGEEESGSLAWLKTLPTGWKSVSSSQIIVATGCLLFSWLFGTICFSAYSASFSEAMLERASAEGNLPEPFWIHLVAVIAFSLALLLSSFFTAYLFRSPITALIVVIPVMILSVTAVANLAAAMSPDAVINGSPEEVASTILGLFTIPSLLGLGTLFLLTRLAAWRRFTWPEARKMRHRVDTSVDAYRPPANPARTMPSITKGRPTQWRALLWLQIAPIRWYLLLFLITGTVGGLMILGESDLMMVGGLNLGGLSFLTLASLTFYGDSVKKRCVFLYDRGISPAAVWMTRVGPTLLASLFILAVGTFALVTRDWWQSGGTMKPEFALGAVYLVFGGIAAFAMTQLVSQWSPRPALAFLAGPVFVHISVLLLAALFITYPEAAPVLLVGSFVLFFASWKLTKKWMMGTSGRQYVAPFLAFIAIAIVLPYVIVLSTRSITTPSKRTAWRQQMLTMELPTRDSDDDRVAILDPTYVRRLEALATGPLVPPEGRDERVQQELEATDSIGEFTSFKELLQVVTMVPDYNLSMHQDLVANNLSLYSNPRYFAKDESQAARDAQFAAVRVLLKWSNEARRQAVVGAADFDVVMGVAEHADLLASRVLNLYVTNEGMSDELASLIELVPDRQLVVDSRKNSLIRSWKRYQSALPNRKFAGEYVKKPTSWWLSVERTRSDRYIDELCNLILDQWASGEDFSSADSKATLLEYQEEAYLGSGWAVSSYYQNMSLEERLEIAAEASSLMRRLRSKLPAPTP